MPVIGLEVLVPLDRRYPDGQLVNGSIDVVHPGSGGS
jgi:hypothetical protein